MSGITGIFRRDGKDVDPADIKKMNDKISHRGPDGSRIWCEGPVAFGHQMLHTTPESLQETLPFEDKESGLVITADARIDNRKELAPKLGIEDKEHVSDSYFILKAYEKWGEKCPEELLGDFSFAIWDKNKEQLFCTRDHMGVKPFYYHISNDLFSFATEIKSLVTLSEVSHNINKLKIGLYLKNIRTDNKLTFYEDIISLSGASSITLTSDICKKAIYWELDPKTEIIMDSDEDYFAAYRKIFAEAVNCRMRSAFPLGFDLSGGLDSSSIVCMAKKILENNNQSFSNMNTFSFVFDDFPEADERYYINKVLDVVGFRSNFIKCDNISTLEEIESILYYQDQPFFSPFFSIWNNIYREIQNKNIRVHLSGNGGDFIVSSGNGYLIELFSNLKLKKLLNEIKCYSKQKRNDFFLYYMATLIPENLKSRIIPIWRKYQNKRLNPQKIIYAEPFDLLNENFLNEIKINDYPREDVWKCNKRSMIAKKNHYNSIFKFPEQETFESIDRLSSPFFVESRFPYFDIRLIEFCYGIPTEMKIRLGWNRFIQRASMTNILPKEVQWRSKKANFLSYIKNNTLKFENSCLEDIVSDCETKISDYVNLEDIHIIHKNYRNNNNIAYFHAFTIWKVMLLSQWIKYNNIL